MRALRKCLSLNEHEMIMAKHVSKNKIHELPLPNEHSVDKICRVGDIVFDQQNGMGQTPYNVDVMYFGFVVMMNPHMFLNIAAYGGSDREMAGSKMIDEINKGRSLASPFLQINGSKMHDREGVVVYGHEGRARCNAIIQLGYDNELIPVAILTAPVRARSLTEEDIDYIANNMQSEVSKMPIKDPFATYYLRNQKYTVKKEVSDSNK